MEYRLAIYHEDASFTTIEGYSDYLLYDELDETSLADIINFTSRFTDEDGLKQFLMYMGLDKSELEGNFAINFYKSKGSIPKALQYGISFKKDKKFFDYNYLLSYYIARQGNVELMDRLLERYFKPLKDIFPDLYHINYINNCLHQYGSIPEDVEDDSLSDFINSYCIKKGKHGNKDISISRLRDLAMLAIDYERSLEEPKQLSIFDLIEQKKCELIHFQTLLRECVTVEERDAYEEAIDKLERSLKD